eukprot:Gregarina_sp_Poly_1__7737@NODE_436_length_8449_cov_138_152470_g356_i0_p2_GENE_NODE_436_length_8449_cov_138_152470_g356_i0NODE_436_length_8449_cov_138_152470_g356_i0_p2_ORF_typecomplete_len378_score46_39Integrin_beta/PF00362_18/1_7e12Integrin_beta/PF00362_18/0_48_NODE_436_length_8449_cov_138_152470_g356_i013612494
MGSQQPDACTMESFFFANLKLSLLFAMLRQFGLCVLADAVKGESQCPGEVDVMHLFDASSSFGYFVQEFQAVSGLSLHLLPEYLPGRHRWGVASFIDKPVPGRGWGAYGNNFWIDDYCYHLGTPLTDNSSLVRENYQAAWDLRRGSGGDEAENPFEALLRLALDDNIGWRTDPNVSRNVLITTDDVGHWPPDAQRGIAQWNAPREYDGSTYSRGGWGSHLYAVTNNVHFQNEVDRNDYLELADLLFFVDFKQPLPSEQQTRLDFLTRKFGPYPWPAVVPHPGDTSMSCDLTDYPHPDQVKQAILNANLNIILMLKDPLWERPEEYIIWYVSQLKLIGVPDPTVLLWADDLQKNARAIVRELHRNRGCPVPTRFPVAT